MEQISYMSYMKQEKLWDTYHLYQACLLVYPYQKYVVLKYCAIIQKNGFKLAFLFFTYPVGLFRRNHLAYLLFWMR